MPAFAHTILNIVRIRTDKKVCGVHARRIIAGVTYIITFWNWSMMHFVTHTMRINIVIFAHSNLTVPCLDFGPNPKPACIRFFDLIPEAS